MNNNIGTFSFQSKAIQTIFQADELLFNSDDLIKAIGAEENANKFYAMIKKMKLVWYYYSSSCV